MKKSLIILLSLVAGLSLVSCNKKELNDLRATVDRLNTPFVLNMQDGVISPAYLLEWETSRHVTIPYTLEGANGEITFSLNIKTENKDNKAKIVASSETEGVLDIYQPYRKYLDNGSWMLEADEMSIDVMAINGDGKTAIKKIRVPWAYFTYDDYNAPGLTRVYSNGASEYPEFHSNEDGAFEISVSHYVESPDYELPYSYDKVIYFSVFGTIPSWIGDALNNPIFSENDHMYYPEDPYAPEAFSNDFIITIAAKKNTTGADRYVDGFFKRNINAEGTFGDTFGQCRFYQDK